MLASSALHGESESRDGEFRVSVSRCQSDTVSVCGYLLSLNPFYPPDFSSAVAELKFLLLHSIKLELFCS